MGKSHQTPLTPTLRYRMPHTSDEVFDSANDPNQWFMDRFPEQAQQYGPAFMEGTWTDADGLKHFIPAYLNEDFFAAILGGNRELGHQVVWCPQEEMWYFFDYRVEAFCPTTEAKLKLLLSNYLIRCSQNGPPLVDITNLVVTFRQDNVLQRIVEKAKAVLEADRSFFQGKDGQRRFVDGRYIEPTAEPAHERFIKHVIVPEPSGSITVTDCYHKFHRYCRESKLVAPTRSEFQALLSDAIRDAFHISLRHDVPSPSGKQTNGWRGITYRQDNHVAMAGRN